MNDWCQALQPKLRWWCYPAWWRTVRLLNNELAEHQTAIIQNPSYKYSPHYPSSFILPKLHVPIARCCTHYPDWIDFYKHYLSLSLSMTSVHSNRAQRLLTWGTENGAFFRHISCIQNNTIRNLKNSIRLFLDWHNWWKFILLQLEIVLRSARVGSLNRFITSYILSAISSRHSTCMPKSVLLRLGSHTMSPKYR